MYVCITSSTVIFPYNPCNVTKNNLRPCVYFNGEYPLPYLTKKSSRKTENLHKGKVQYSNKYYATLIIVVLILANLVGISEIAKLYAR